MKKSAFKNSTRILAAMAALAVTGASQGSTTVDPGWDLFTTAPGTTFMGVPFVGVPLGTFDFGGAFGIMPTGLTDTIVHRTTGASAPAGTISTVMVALQLMSAVPFDPDGPGPGPLGTYYVTLQSARLPIEGPPVPTLGTIDITFGPEAPVHGSFDSFFDVFFDLRFGGVGGPIALSGELPLTGTGNLWGHTAPPGSLVIEGVNHDLAGPGDPSHDFFPVGSVVERKGPDFHIVQPTPSIPEPLACGQIVLGVALLGSLRRARR